MNLKSAEQLLSCYRVNRPVGSRVGKAVRMATGDATLKQRLDAQQRWDNQLVDVIRSLEPPEKLRNKLNALGSTGSEKGARQKQLRKTGMLAVLLGIVVMLCFAVSLSVNRWEDFPGKEAVLRMLDVTRAMNGAELEPVRAETSKLGDWFYIRGFEGYAVPAELASLQAVGCRVFRQSGQPVAQVAVDSRNALVYIFRPNDFGVDLPESGDWKLFEHEGWAAAIRLQGSTCTMLAFRGTRTEMKRFLRSLTPKGDQG